MRLGLLLGVLLLASPISAATLRVAVPALPPSLGVPFTAVGQPSNGTWSAIFDALTRLDPDGSLQPALAVAWKPLSPRLWQFTLRPGVVFHDGTPLTAAAVADSLAILRTPAAQKFYVASEMQNLTAIRATGPLTLEIETRTADAILPKRMSILSIVSAAAWTRLGEAAFAQTPVGTGPFKVADWGQSSGSAQLVAATESWRAPRGFDALELVPLESPVGRLQALLSGRVDVAARMDTDTLPQVTAASFQVASLPLPQVLSLQFRVAGNARSPIADLRVRRALSLAVNRSLIAQQILQGQAAPASQAASPETAGYDPGIAVPAYDPEAAKQLLREAGFPNGFPLTAEVLVGVSPADDLIFEQTVQDLRRIGVAITLRSIPYPVWLRKYASGQWRGVDAFSLVWDAASFYDVIRPITNASCRKRPPFFCDPSIMPLIDAVDAEMDEHRRLSLLQELERRTAELAPALWLVTVSQHYGIAPNLTDVGLRNTGVTYETIRPRP